MSTLHRALAAQKQTQNSPAWALLRSRNAAAAVAILAEHLAGEVKRIAAPVLFERIEEDLLVLREQDFDLPRTAKAYCAEWLNDGILIRRASGESREETFELSDGALVAIRFVAQLVDPRQSVTESRLAMILERVHQLAVATDPDASTRLAALQADRDRIDAEIARVGQGDYVVLSVGSAMEQARDILAMAEEIPADFARVRAEMETINKDLRQRLVEQTESRGAVLDDVFRGVDHLAESDAGRSFNGFHSLVLDAERTTEFEDNVARLLARQFAENLGPAQSRLLRRLLPTLQDNSSEIHGVMTTFSRSLRRFVQSQELAEDRQINGLLRDAQREAIALSSHVAPYQRTDLELSLSSVQTSSVSAFALHNPADNETVDDVVTHDSPPVDIASLMEISRASEIDLKELRASVNSTLARQGAATISEILAERPASQGVASVVGLLVLAGRHASMLDGHEMVQWLSVTGSPRYGTVPRALFKEKLP